MSDNQGARALAYNPENHARTKHIDVQYHYIRHLIDSSKVTVEYCPTNKMLADALTKPLAKKALYECIGGIFGHPNSLVISGGKPN
jgi:hypothetical protein